MDMSPADSEQIWVPTWDTRETGSGGIWIVNWANAATVYIDFPVEGLRVVAGRVSAWLDGYLFAAGRQPRLQWTVGAAWLVLGPKYFGGQAYYGTEAVTAVREIGFGSDPSAPEAAKEVEARRLLEILIAKLDGGEPPVEVL
jgi:hypothetical protein